MSNLRHNLRAFYFSKGFLWFVIALGIFLRLRQYVFNRSLWTDEAVLAINIITRSWSELLVPLEGKLIVPVGFLMSQKLAAIVLGPSEYALRLCPLVAGVLALVLFRRLCIKAVTPAAVPLAMVIFATSGPLIYFSSEAKQYSVDVLVAVVVLLAALRILERPFLSGPQAFVYGMAGAVVVWFSHPAVFLLSAAAVLIILKARRQTQPLIGVITMVGLWFVGFVVCYLFSKRYVLAETDRYLHQYWQEGFPPLTWSAASFKWYVRAALQTFENPGGFSFRALAAVMCLAGLWDFWACRKRMALGVLALPIIVVFLAAVLRIYPFSGRLILFIVPSLILLVAQGAGVVTRAATFRGRPWGIIFVFFLLAMPVASAFSYAVTPMIREEIRPVIRYLEVQMKPGDILYIYEGAWRGFRYYSTLDRWSPVFVKGVVSHHNRQAYLDDLNRLEGSSRVWLLFSHVFGDERTFMLDALNRNGTPLERIELDGNRIFGFKGQAAESSAYLYDLSRKSR